ALTPRAGAPARSSAMMVGRSRLGVLHFTEEDVLGGLASCRPGISRRRYCYQRPGLEGRDTRQGFLDRAGYSGFRHRSEPGEPTSGGFLLVAIQLGEYPGETLTQIVLDVAGRLDHYPDNVAQVTFPAPFRRKGTSLPGRQWKAKVHRRR